MNRFATIALLLIATVLTGCAGQGHSMLELHPYTALEVRQKALEDLSRQGLSFDEYQLKRAQLQGQPVRDFDFDGQDELNAGRSNGNREAHQG
jgi:hypothetical protein